MMIRRYLSPDDKYRLFQKDYKRSFQTCISIRGGRHGNKDYKIDS